jgi:serine/threonine protein phosphatase 1
MVKTKLTTPAPGWVAPGGRIYAIGDVHGCAGRLADLHRMIEADLARDPAERPLLLHIGDYVDRGMDSARVVEMLSAGSPIAGVPVVNLRGNHEQMMLDALSGNPHAVAHWLDNNAASTLRSWGVAASAPVNAWRAAIGEQDMAFLNGLALHHRVDGYIFVHAGLRPGVPFPRQTAEDMLWIREEFLHHRGPVLPDEPELAVVHGHTPEPRPVVTKCRIGIDTGAVKGGALTCAVLEGGTVRFLVN